MTFPHRRISSAAAACVVVTAAALFPARAASDGPPVAPVKVVVDDYHGTKVEDPYRYMENFADPAVQAWVKAQGEFARKTLDAIPDRAALLKRIKELDEGAPFRAGVVRRWPDGGMHLMKRLASENVDKLYYRPVNAPADGSGDRLLIDPETRKSPGGGHVTLSFAVPSPSRRYIAYGLAASGSEQTTLYVLDTETGKDLEGEVIERMEFDYTEPSWLPDSSGFVYSQRQELPAGAPPTDIYKKSSAHVHRINSAATAADPVIFAMGLSPHVTMSEEDFPSVVLTDGSRFAIGKIKHGDTNELTLYTAPIETLGRADTPWKKICDVADDVEDFAVRGGDVYLRTATGAPRYRVVRTSLLEPKFEHATVVVPGGEPVVTSIAVAADGLYVNLVDGATSAVGRIGFGEGGSAELERLTLPDGFTSGFASGIEADVEGAVVGTTSWTRAGRSYFFNPRTGQYTDTGLRPQGKFDNPEGYVSREVEVTSHDGVKVPLSIVHKAGLELDGSNPTWLSGYGAYGMTTHVHFSPTSLAWMERGGVLAMAHVRGGGERGKPWHHAGRMATKPNTWKDFIACGEWLCKEGYTSPAKLGGEGTSAGGILIGRAVTERPDLFGAAIINVGCTDMLRSETTTNGVPNIQEFGSVATKEGFLALREMSAYDHVTPGTKYPAIMLIHGTNDPRVEPWMTAKMTARLQADTASGRPVIFRVDYDAGHGIGSTKTQRQEKEADEMAFLLWQLGSKR